MSKTATNPAKIAQGYEAKPPQCSSCKHFMLQRVGTPGQHPVCALGRFVIRPSAVCNVWTGKNGDTLE